MSARSFDPKHSIPETIDYVSRSIRNKKGQLEYELARLNLQDPATTALIKEKPADSSASNPNLLLGIFDAVANGVSSAASYAASFLPTSQSAVVEESQEKRNLKAALELLNKLQENLPSFEALKKHYEAEQDVAVKKLYQAIAEGVVDEKIKILSESLAVDVSGFDAEKVMTHIDRLREAGETLKKIHFDAESVDLNKETELDKIVLNIEKQRTACSNKLDFIADGNEQKRMLEERRKSKEKAEKTQKEMQARQVLFEKRQKEQQGKRALVRTLEKAAKKEFESFMSNINISNYYHAVVYKNESQVKAKAQMAARKSDIESLQIEINRIKKDPKISVQDKPAALLKVVQALKEKMSVGKKEFSSVGMGNFEKMLEKIEKSLLRFSGQVIRPTAPNTGGRITPKKK